MVNFSIAMLVYRRVDRLVQGTVGILAHLTGEWWNRGNREEEGMAYTPNIRDGVS